MAAPSQPRLMGPITASLAAATKCLLLGKARFTFTCMTERTATTTTTASKMIEATTWHLGKGKQGGLRPPLFFFFFLLTIQSGSDKLIAESEGGAVSPRYLASAEGVLLE